MAAPNPIDKSLRAVADALLKEKKVLLTTHIKPDGDALGCIIALHQAMVQAGADSVMYLAEDRPVAPEYGFLRGLEEVRAGSVPGDAASRTLVAVDCSNAERIGNDELVRQAPRIINIDHHSDNPRYGEINLVIGDASSTAEIIFFIMKNMGTEITPVIAEALYTGILVDSGRFQYASVSPTTFRIAADLLSAGVDHTAIFRQIFESEPLAKARLRCMMIDSIRFACDGRLAIGLLESEDFQSAGAGIELTDGLINSLRELEGIEVAALIYALPTEEEPGGTPGYRVSLRSSSGTANVQRIARKMGGGGHPQAAGFTASGKTPDELVRFLGEQVAAALRHKSVGKKSTDG